MPVHSLSVAEAARRLGVNQARVRAMISASVLDAVKVGGRWLVEPQSIERRVRSDVSVGRPLSSANAWGVLWVAAGLEPSWLSASALSRVRRRLREDGLIALAPRLRTRAQTHRLRAHPSDVERIGAEECVVRTGISTVRDHDLLLVAPGRVEAYVREPDLDELMARYALRPDAVEHNVLFRIVSGIWPFEVESRVAPVPVVGVDLMASDDARTRREGVQLLEGVESRWST